MPDIVTIILIVLAAIVVIGPRRLPEGAEALYYILTDLQLSQAGRQPLGSLHNARIYWISNKSSIYTIIRVLYGVTEHLEELRSRLLVVFAVFLVVLLGSLFFAQTLLTLLVRPIALIPNKDVKDAPVNQFILTQPLPLQSTFITASGTFSGTVTIPSGTVLSLAQVTTTPVITKPTEIFGIYIQLALVVAFAVSLPVILLQVLSFVRGPRSDYAKPDKKEWQTVVAQLSSPQAHTLLDKLSDDEWGYLRLTLDEQQLKQVLNKLNGQEQKILTNLLNSPTWQKLRYGSTDVTWMKVRRFGKTGRLRRSFLPFLMTGWDSLQAELATELVERMLVQLTDTEWRQVHNTIQSAEWHSLQAKISNDTWLHLRLTLLPEDWQVIRERLDAPERAQLQEIVTNKNWNRVRAKLSEMHWEKIKPIALAEKWAQVDVLRENVYEGLTAHEVRPMYLMTPFALVLFLSGALFTYFVLLPAALDFLFGLTGQVAQALPSLDEYYAFSIALIFWVGLTFELPLLMFFLARFNVITARQFAQQWRYAVVIIVVISAVITPTVDPFNMSLVALPMLGLYLLGIGFAWLARPRASKNLALPSSTPS